MPEQATGARVCAAVVTYNRKELLVECLEALLRQSHPVSRVVVVDNASTDGTPDLLRERGLLDDERLAYDRLDENLGSSGGFARAVDAARDFDADWIWVMDDDAEAPDDGLATLLASPPAADEATAALCPAVVSPDGSLQLGARGHFTGRPLPLPEEEYSGHPALGFSTFVGICVRTRVARATDPPKAEMFIWADDYEWCLRLRRFGTLRLVPESRIVHKDVGHGFETRRGRMVNRLTGWSYGATPYDGFWRNIAGARNYVWIRKTYEDESALGAARTTAQLIAKALLYDEKPLRRIPWLVRATVDGRRGVFRTITPQEWSERLARDGARAWRRPRRSAAPRG